MIASTFFMEASRTGGEMRAPRLRQPLRACKDSFRDLRERRRTLDGARGECAVSHRLEAARAAEDVGALAVLREVESGELLVVGDADAARDRARHGQTRERADDRD